LAGWPSDLDGVGCRMEVEVVLRPFEEEIVNKFKVFSWKHGGGKAIPRKGVWIKQHLLDVNEDFVYGMWQRWIAFVRVARDMKAEIELGTYAAFRTYIYLLKKYGLIVPTKRERARTTSPGFFRQYYRVNTRLLKDPRWLNPYKPYPSWAKQYEEGFPRPKKKPRLKLPPAVIPPYPWLSSEEINRIWTRAERFLRQHGYSLTREKLEEIFPDWTIEAAGYKTFKDRVAFVIHEAVEIEEVSRVARRLISPREAPEPIASKAHEVAERMEREYKRM